MIERQSFPRRIALALMKHAAHVLPVARQDWAHAMQRELPEAEDDLEALSWACGCLLASYSERTRELAAIPKRWKAIGLLTLAAATACVAAHWWTGQRPYLSPGTDRIFRQDSNIGALLAIGLFLAAAAGGLASAHLYLNGKVIAAARLRWASASAVIFYLLAVMAVSLAAPQSTVNIGDSYCYDLWCLGVRQVKAAPMGANILYTAEVRIFSDSEHEHRVPVEHAKDFFRVLDDKGRRFPLLQASSFQNINVTVKPGESVKSIVAFLAPADAKKLFLTGDSGIAPPWVYLYLGSDIAPFHRRTLLRVF